MLSSLQRIISMEDPEAYLRRLRKATLWVTVMLSVSVINSLAITFLVLGSIWKWHPIPATTAGWIAFGLGTLNFALGRIACWVEQKQSVK